MLLQYFREFENEKDVGDGHFSARSYLPNMSYVKIINCIFVFLLNSNLGPNFFFQVPRDNPAGTTAFLRDMTSFG